MSRIGERNIMSGIVSYLGRSITVAWVTSLLGSNPVHAQSASFIRDCQKWIDKKGYSTDYIEQKTGKRQSGLASSWRGNVRVQGIQPGDVVLVRLRVPGACTQLLSKRSAGTPPARSARYAFPNGTGAG